MPSLREAILSSTERIGYFASLPNPASQLVQALVHTIDQVSKHTLGDASRNLFIGGIRDGNRVHKSILAQSPPDAAAIRGISETARRTLGNIHTTAPFAFEDARTSQIHLEKLLRPHDDILVQGTRGNPDHLWAKQLQLDIQHLVYITSGKMRLTVLADREDRNLRGIVDACNQPNCPYELSGILAPRDDLDDRIVDVLNGLDDVRLYGQIHPLGENGDLYASGLLKPFLPFYHCRYRPDQMFMNSEDGAQEFCMDTLIPMILKTKPDIVFMANFLYILHSEAVQKLEEMGILVVNIHPSLLPENRQWRPELKALTGINPHASGMTYHIGRKVVDEGETLLHVPFPLIPFSTSLAADEYAGKKYSNTREEMQRWMQIRHQRHYTPLVLQYLCNGTPRKVVENDEAFQAEGRSKPKDFLEKYMRMLFQIDDNWHTLEKLISGRPIEPVSQVGVNHSYRFTIPGSLNGYVQQNGGPLQHVLEEARRNTPDEPAYTTSMGATGIDVLIETASPTFPEWLKRMGILENTLVVKHSTHASAKRKPHPTAVKSRIVIA